MILFATIYCFYFVLVAMLMYGWNKFVNHKNPRPTSEKFISVIVAVRNEERNIPSLLESLLSQNYKRFEIIVVDDHSEDGTALLIQQRHSPLIKLIQNSGEGKKNAITTGIKNANGELIVTTDADCWQPADWLLAFNNCFINESVMMVAGTVKIVGNNFFHSLQQMEFAALVGSGASSAAIGYPTMCNGASLAFRKDAFFAVNGYEGNETIASGDDEFLMRKITKVFHGGFEFTNQSPVITQPQFSIASFLHQRIRWAAKWKYNSSLHAKVLAVFMVLVQFMTLFAAWQFFNGHLFFVSIVTIKIVFEAWLIYRFFKFFKIGFHWRTFLVLQIVYPLYVITIGLTSFFSGYSWKSRNYN